MTFSPVKMTVMTTRRERFVDASVAARTSMSPRLMPKTRKKLKQFLRVLTTGLKRKRQPDLPLSGSRRKKRKRCVGSYLSSSSVRKLKNLPRSKGRQMKPVVRRSVKIKSIRTA